MSKIQNNHPSVEMINIDQLTRPKRQLRNVTERHIEKIAASIREFGLMGAILADADGQVIAGAIRLEAARRLGYTEMPVICVRHLTKEQIKAYRVADNKLAEGVDWNEHELRLEFEEILTLDVDFEFGVTGFSTGELDVIMDPSSEADPADTMDVSPDEVAVTRPGDLWQVGQHRLICGDAKLPATYDTLMGGETARLVAIDPPYNVGIASIMGLGGTKYREFAEASGEMSREEFEAFLTASLFAMTKHVQPGGCCYSFMDWKHIDTLLAAGRALGLELLNIAVWNKMKGGMGSFYRSAHELCAVFKKPGASHLNNIELGRHGRNRTNVWSEPGFASFGRERTKRLADHPTVKPVVIIADIIKDASRRGDIVMDGFCGSGTMLIAAQKTGRVARCVELDPLYVDVALRRFHERFGIEAIHIESGLPFAELADMRRAESASIGLGSCAGGAPSGKRSGRAGSPIAPRRTESESPTKRPRRIPTWLDENSRAAPNKAV